MKTAKLVIGIISMVLSFFIMFQSCAAGIVNTVASNGEVSGTAGLIVAVFFIIAGIVGVATRNSLGMAGSLTAGGFYLAAALIGSITAGNYTDLYIWSFLAWSFGVVYLVAAFYDQYDIWGAASWWQKSWFIILITIVFPPAGIALVWISRKFELAPRIIMTVIFSIAFLISMASFMGMADTRENKPINMNNTNNTNNTNTNTTTDSKVTEDTQKNKVYGLGETWTVDGEFSLSFTAVTATDDRNQFSEKTPGQVVILNYDYNNIGVEKSFMELYIDSNDFNVIDANGEVASTYPASIAVHPQETPIGAKCVGAQCAYGLNNPSSEITVKVQVHGNNFKSYEAVFKLPVQ